jgi:hypothetical protein
VKTLANEVDKREVLKRLVALGTASRRRWGRMSCHQMVRHLSDAFLCPLGEKMASPVKSPIPQGIFKWFALYVPLPWPHGVPTRPEMEQGIGGTAPVEFSRDREKVVELIERFCGAPGRFAAHPIFGEMSEKDWMRWGYLHCDHHLRQFGQ